MSELDDHKSSGNTRRGKRARRAVSLISKLMDAPNHEDEVRQKNPRVIIGLAPVVEASHDRHPMLDMNRPDDRIIDETMAYARTHQQDNVFLLTGDTGPRFKALNVNFPCKPIPESWMLTAEKDEKDKKIDELVQKIKTLEQNYPIITIDLMDELNQQISQIDLKWTKFAPLDDAVVRALTAEAEKHVPAIRDFSQKPNWLSHYRLAHRVDPPSHHEINDYLNNYDSWLEAVRDFFYNLPNILEQSHTQILACISNIGGKPAEHVTVELKSLGNGVLLSLKNAESVEDIDGAENISIMSIPKPPSPPTWKATPIMQGLGDKLSKVARASVVAQGLPNVGFMARPKPREKNKFYFKRHTPQLHTQALELECEEFRHQMASAEFLVRLDVVESFHSSKKQSIQIIVHASNLPTPEKRVIPIKIKIEQGDTETAAQEILKNWMHETKAGATRS